LEIRKRESGGSIYKMSENPGKTDMQGKTLFRALEEMRALKMASIE